MYASNEDEFDREHADWVFLHQSAPGNTALHGAMNILDHEPVVVSSSSSSSSSDSDSASPTSNRSESLSSVSSVEEERAEHDDLSVTAASPSSADDPVLPSQVEAEVEEVKEHGVSSEISMQSIHHGETSPVINEYELPNGACDSKTEPVTPSTPVRRRITEQPTPTVEHERRFVRPPLPARRSETRSPLIVYLVLALLVALPLILCRFATSQRLVLDRMTENLQKTNQRLDQIKSVSVEDLEQKLTKQLEAKFHELLQQKLAEHEREKYSLVLQINELYYNIHMAQQNFSNAIEQLSMENEQLHTQLRALEERQQTSDQKSPDEADFNTPSVSPLDILIGNVVQQASSIAENTTLNLGGFFGQLSASLSDIVDNRHEYVEESKRKLNDLAGSRAAEKVQKTILRSVENLSSSLHKARSTYATWVRSRAQQREQARMDSAGHDKQGQSARRPWRWTFQRGQERQQMRQHDTPTKRHWAQKEHVCHSTYEFPVNQLCTMKNWMERFFRP